MPSLKFFKGVLVPNFNKTFGRGLVLMAVPQSQESFSTVGTKLSTWLNILRPGANVMAEGRKRRGGGDISGDDCTISAISTCRDTWNKAQLSKHIIHTETLRRRGNMRWPSPCPQNRPPSARI